MMYLSIKKVINLRNLSTDLTLINYLFRPVKLTNNANLDKCKYTGYGIGFDSCSEVLFTDGSLEKMALCLELIFAHLCMLMIREKIWIFAEGPKQGLDDNKLTAEANILLTLHNQEKDLH